MAMIVQVGVIFASLGIVGAAGVVGSLYYGRSQHQSVLSSAENFPLTEGKLTIKRSKSEEEFQCTPDEEEDSDAASEVTPIQKDWQRGVSIQDTLARAQKFLGPKFTRTYDCVPTAKMRGPFSAGMCGALVRHIQSRCDKLNVELKVTEWICAFLALYIERQKVHTRTTYTLTFEINEEKIKCILFLIDLAIKPESKMQEGYPQKDVIEEVELTDQVRTKMPSGSSSEMVYFSCIAIEYDPRLA